MDDKTQQYDAVGNNTAAQQFYQSPASNPGVVYDAANEPTNPGALKVARQTSENIVWVTKDGSKIDIGTQNTSPSTAEGEAGIVITDKDGGVVVSLTQGHPVAFLVTSRPLTTTPQRDTPISFIQVFDDSLQSESALDIEVDNMSNGISVQVDGSGHGIVVTGDGTETNSMTTIENTNTANFNSVLELGNNAVQSSHFRKMQNLQGLHIWISDGTTPLGNLTAERGAICYGGPNGQPFYNSIAGSSTWVGM